MKAGFTRFEIVTTTAAFYLCLGFVCVFVEAGRLENELAVEARQAATDEALYWVAARADGDGIVLSGAASSDDAHREALARVAAVAGVNRVVDEIEVVGDQGLCQRALDRELARSAVEFRGTEGELTDASLVSVQALANVALQCGTKIEVAVHTAGRGDADVNQQISQRRAEQLARTLVRAGVPATRLIASGLGEQQPIALHDGKDDERNERVELRVRSLKA